MLCEYVSNIIIKNGFFKADINLDNIVVFIERDKSDNKIIILCNLIKSSISKDKYNKIVKKIIDRCLQSGLNCYKCLNIILCNKYKDAKELGYVECLEHKNQFNEFIVVDNKKNVYPDQLIDEVNNNIRQKILSNSIEEIESTKQEDINSVKKRQEKTYSYEQNEYIEYLKMSIVHIAIINMIIFIITDLVFGNYSADIFVNYGSSWEGIVEKRQVYRVITSLFLHSGIDHISGNMISLLIIGIYLEKNIGRYKLLFIYFSTGIIADLVSISYNMYIGEIYTPSVGASGAIFGLTGAFLAILLIQRNRGSVSNARRMIIYIALSLYGGIASSDSIDNAAHIGGLLSGMLIAAIMFYFVPKIRAEINNNSK